MKKRLLIVIALALALVLALTLAACGGSTEQNPDSGTPPTPDGGQTPETPDDGEQTPETPDEGETPVPPVTYTVTFETNGGSAVQPATVDEGEAITSAPETTLDGYEFGGWYFSADLSDDALVTFPYTPAGSTTLYAKWSKILTAADLYNEVFGENYSLKSFNQFLDELMDDVLSSVSEYQVLFADLTEDNFTIYSNAKLIQGKTVLAQSKYKGNDTKTILDFYELSKQIGEKTFKDYILETIGSEIIIDSSDYQAKVEQLQNIKSQADLFASTISSISKSQFTTTTPITNTTTPIDFSKFTEKFMPAGVTPIACYVGDFSGRLINTKYLTGDYPYYSGIDIAIVYLTSNGNIVIDDMSYVVGALNNQEISESLYNRMLNGNEAVDYELRIVDTTTIENPIWTGYTVGVTK